MGHKLITSLLAFCLAFTLIGPSLLAGDKQEQGIKWLKYDKALELAKKEGRHVLVDFETKWCGYCKKMAATTYRDSGIVATLNKYFALAKVDGDSYDLVKLSDGEITEKGLTRQYSVTGYPTTWMLEPDGTKIAPVRGYVDAVRFQYILDYIYTNSNEKMSFKEFVEQETLKQGKK
jgi:thioredoxin-related protein